jgi:pimeloyl-ACP methyl ester carboxylesterase
MARTRINDIELYYELMGDGDTVVLVHGSWTDHSSWRLVAPQLAERYRVLTYDRRGHSRSERSAVHATRRRDEDDLVGLIESLDLGAVHLVGNSYGGSISLALAARRPDLVRSVAAHEPPLIDVARPGTPLADELAPARSLLDEVADMLRAGDLEEAAKHFIEQVALGPGNWQVLPDDLQRTLVANAAMFLDLLADPQWGNVPSPIDVPVFLTDGDASPPWLPAIVRSLTSDVLPQARRCTFAGAGHAPHLTHPESYTTSIEAFVSARTTRRLTDERLT